MRAQASTGTFCMCVYMIVREGDDEVFKSWDLWIGIENSISIHSQLENCVCTHNRIHTLLSMSAIQGG